MKDTKQRRIHFSDREKRTMRFWLRFVRTAKQVEAEVNSRMLRDHGIRFVRFDVLSQLYRAPERRLSISDLGASILSHSGNISALIFRMEKDGLVHRVADVNDRRRFFIEMTELGLDQFYELANANAQWITAIFSGINDTKLDHLYEELQSVNESLS